MPLADLPPGARAVVERVDPGLAIGRRLLDLGFVPGTEVRVVRRAPLGDPVELRDPRHAAVPAPRATRAQVVGRAGRPESRVSALAAIAHPLRLGLLGAPNAGKTTLFNALTGLRARVGNYPGVTVERREGALRVGEREAVVLDLPGTYSLEPQSPDEAVVTRVLAGELVAGARRADRGGRRLHPRALAAVRGAGAAARGCPPASCSR